MRITATFVASILIFQCLSALAEGFSITDPAKSLFIKKDQNILTVTLKSNRTTGYSWFIKNYDHNLLSLKSYQYIAPNTAAGGKAPIVGAPGLESWQFTVKPEAHIAPQASEIDLIYIRPWEISNSSQETVIHWFS